MRLEVGAGAFKHLYKVQSRACTSSRMTHDNSRAGRVLSQPRGWLDTDWLFSLNSIVLHYGIQHRLASVYASANP